MEAVHMGLGQILMPVRAWWFLRIVRNASIPPDIGRYLMALKNRNQLAIEDIERKRQTIIDHGAASGKTVSTEAALKHVLELKTKYDGPNPEEYVSEIDRFANEFREKHGSQIPVDQAYVMLKELETLLSRIE
jgi:hypothetical protein